MTFQDILDRAEQLGLTLTLKGEQVSITPKGVAPPELLAAMRIHKAQLISHLTPALERGWQSVPPIDLPYPPRMPQPSEQEFQRVVTFIIRQKGKKPGKLFEWVNLRIEGYFEGVGKDWTRLIVEYAVARDAACWQLGACWKTTRGVVFGEKAGWQGATKENIPGGSSTEEQRSQTAFSPKTLRATGLLSGASVGSALTARCGDAPASPPWPQPKSLVAAPLVVFQQAPNKTEPALLEQLQIFEEVAESMRDGW